MSDHEVRPHFTAEAVAQSVAAVKSVRGVIDAHPDLESLFDLGIVRIDDRSLRVLAGQLRGEVPVVWLVIEGEPDVMPFTLPALTLTRLRQKLDRAANHLGSNLHHRR